MRQECHITSKAIYPLPWRENSPGLIFDLKDKRFALVDVLDQLCSAENNPRQWEGTIYLRLHAILHLYFFLESKECQEPVREAMLHYYPLLVTSQSDTEEKTLHQDFFEDSGLYFKHLFGESPSIFQSFCSAFTSREITSLPIAVFHCINSCTDMMTNRSQEDLDFTKHAAAGLDDLFQHFLLSEDLDPTSPQVEEGRYHTLTSILYSVGISFYNRPLSADCTPDPNWWKLSYSWLALMEQQLAKFSTIQHLPTLAGHDVGDDHYHTVDGIGNHSVHAANKHPITKEHLCKLINMMKEVLDQYPLPLPLVGVQDPQLND
jgi:hypothetical protein